MSDISLHELSLGRQTQYPTEYTPSLLFPVVRAENRKKLGLDDEKLPFFGVDIWNAYEVSWLEIETRKPRIAIVEFTIPCESENLIESKSFKLYLNSFNQSEFKTETDVKEVLKADLSRAVGSPVRVHLVLPPFDHFTHPIRDFSGTYLDDLPLSIKHFHPNPSLLSVESGEQVNEHLYSNLLKSNCPVTNQPDWGSVSIKYRGPKINQISLLKYIISYRNHVEFHEQCVERIYMDIMKNCQPEKLSVYARYTRRGGLDINPFRSNFEDRPTNVRNLRQ